MELSKEQIEKRSPDITLCLFLGGVIGFISGLIGIGGGIILSPVLLMLRWTDIKETAAISALFIFVNSMAGITGQIQAGFSLPSHWLYYAAFTLTGAVIGSYMGSQKFEPRLLKMLLTLILLLAAAKLLFTSWNISGLDYFCLQVWKLIFSYSDILLKRWETASRCLR